MEPKIKAIGIMSGTSLDGVDIAACEFSFINKRWNYQISAATTFEYPISLLKQLKLAPELSGFELSKLHVDYGKFIGKLVNRFIGETQFAPEFIASHGYTVFHQPEIGLTLQIGSGAEISAITGIKTVCDFRTSDVALGGQGAPLVPIGDRLLFGEYDACLNLGGFSNISFEHGKQRIAFDICPVNILLNHMALKAGLNYDKDGNLGKVGMVNNELLSKLNQLEFYTKEPPKSLGREFLDQQIIPLFEESGLTIYDQLRTAYEHTAYQISKAVEQWNIQSVLVTGGGTHNQFLMELLHQKSNCQFVVPEKEVIDFKEALVFAFLGLLRINEQPNCLKSVTGSKSDNIGGAVYF